ncbi:MAG: right-handed parallel beta-helix repeat-containing protein [Defluviicoccus sp.]|nr:MAG: right-handed parallel beta-helix repeat-containing protein [Defluviicoccus sp.]
MTIASGSGSALAISGNADVTGHGLIIRDSGEAGVSVRDGGRLVLDDSSVETSRSAGISLVNSGEVTLSNDRIVGSAGTGIVVADNSKARLIDNFVAGNAWSGVEVLRSASAEVTGNVISGNREAGIYLSRDGGGHFPAIASPKAACPGSSLTPRRAPSTTTKCRRTPRMASTSVEAARPALSTTRSRATKVTVSR